MKEIVLDTETTGISVKEGHRIVEIGCIELNDLIPTKNKLFYDVIYNPNETNFLKIGKRLGNEIENGKLMFIYQAFSAFNLWHGVRPKINNEIIKLLNND